jgi:2-(1,2-epoxy-1,2-dihydrophenyl)acetyl-CoA isomerase
LSQGTQHFGLAFRVATLVRRELEPRREVLGIYRELVEEGESRSERLVHVERAAERAIVTLDEPDRLNALSARMVIPVKQTLAELVADPAIRTVVLTGAGKGLSAGGDLRMMRLAKDRLGAPEGATDVWRWIRYEFGGVVRLIVRSDTAFVAALNGRAAGVGLAWALACDVIVASEEAVLGPAFGRLGLLPEVGTSWTLTRRLGYQGAFAFFVGGRHLTAAEARDAGLVQEVVPDGELQAAASRWCDNVEALPAHPLAMAKPLLRAAADASWETALATEEFAEPNCFTTGSFQDAVRGMRESRA